MTLPSITPCLGLGGLEARGPGLVTCWLCKPKTRTRPGAGKEGLAAAACRDQPLSSISPPKLAQQPATPGCLSRQCSGRGARVRGPSTKGKPRDRKGVHGWLKKQAGDLESQREAPEGDRGRQASPAPATPPQPHPTSHKAPTLNA